MLIAIVLSLIICKERGRISREHRLDVSAARLPIVREIVIGPNKSLAFLVRGMETEEICHGSNIQQESKQKLKYCT